MVERTGATIVVYGEMTDGSLDVRTLELLSLGKRLAGEGNGDLAVVLMGEGIGETAEALTSFGAQRVYAVEHPLLAGPQADARVEVMERLCREIGPQVLLLPHSYGGMEVAPRLAYRLRSVLTTDCIDVRVDPEDGLLLRTKPVCGGNAIGVFKYDGRPQMVTIREKVLRRVERTASKGEVVSVPADIDESPMGIRLIERVREETVNLDKADVILSGGRGLGGKEGFEEMARLRGVLQMVFDRVEIGASRVPVDAGWTSSNRQIGLTGAKVAPALYMAIGISGAIQHLVGIAKSKKIVAINKDENANIFHVADYGVVGDYRKVLQGFVSEWEAGS